MPKMQISQDMAAKLIAQGWTPETLSMSYDVVGGNGGVPWAAPSNVRAGDPPPAQGSGYTGLGIFPWETPAGVGFRAPWTPQNGGAAPAVAGALPPAVVTGLGALGLGAAATALGGVYGVSQAIGVQYPWETGPGEGFIAPWNRDIVKDESGRWVTRATRPDLFNGAGTALVPRGGVAMAGGFGPQVVHTWTANGWPFAMTSDGRIHTVTKHGIRKSWRPYRSVVLGKKISTRQAKGAVRKLTQIVDLSKAIQKLKG